MASSADPYNLQRFLDAQSPELEQVRVELRAGQKRSHWMWFVFPQLRGLGRSELASYYGISSPEEAKAYLAHPVLGPRLKECTRLVIMVEGRSIDDILGYPDNLKFRSSMTLFASAESDDPIFREALQKYFVGEPDQRTLDLL